METTTDIEEDTLLASIFKESFPDDWTKNPDFFQYLSELSSFGIEKLARQPEKLYEEKASILEETQDLAFHNYKTFIQTAECSRKIYHDFGIIEEQLESLMGRLPQLRTECEDFVTCALDITSSRRMNSLILDRHSQLLEILEVPQLMDTCVRNGYYDEALELSQHVKRWEKKFTNIPVIMNIANDVRHSSQLMLNHLLKQLRSDIQLPTCLKVIGYIRRMDVFREAELRVKFLQARDTWLQTVLSSISTDDPYSRICKIIEQSRMHLFDIITQYRAIFSDDDPWLNVGHDDIPNESSIFHGWVNLKVSQFLHTLISALQDGVGGRLDSVLGQCMYFGLSFSRVGADFRCILIPIFQNAAFAYFQSALASANTRFEESMRTYLLSTPTRNVTQSTSSLPNEQLTPSTILLSYPPLALYCNDLLTALNNLRVCAPLGIAFDVADALTSSLTHASTVIAAFHRAEEATFSDDEKSVFTGFCETFTQSLIPHVNNCLSALFTSSQINSAIGHSTGQLSAKLMVSIDSEQVLMSIRHLLPPTTLDQQGEEGALDHQSDDPLTTDADNEEDPHIKNDEHPTNTVKFTGPSLMDAEMEIDLDSIFPENK